MVNETIEMDSKVPRNQIIRTYAKWTALSALRQGPSTKDSTVNVRGKDPVYPIIDDIDFDSVLDADNGPIIQDEFEKWHQSTLETIVVDPRMGENREHGLLYGWAAKIVNVYLKTANYAGGLGRPGLEDLLHPPMDDGLWRGVKRRFGENDPLVCRTREVIRISHINSHSLYKRLIEAFRELSTRENCKLIEVEQWWVV